MNEKSFYRWRKDGTLGEVCHPQTKSISHTPVYISGFWFSSLIDAAVILKKMKSELQHLMRKGDIEAQLKIVGTKPRKKSKDSFVGVNQTENGKFKTVLFYQKEKILSKTFQSELDAAVAYDDCYEGFYGIRPNKTTPQICIT